MTYFFRNRHIIGIFFLCFVRVALAGHGDTLSGRGAIEDQLQGGAQGAQAAQGGAGGAKGGYGAAGGGGGGANVPESPNRKKADEPKEIAKKAEENLNKMTDKATAAIEKLSQSFSSSLANLKAPEDDKAILKGLGDDQAKRNEALAKDPAIGGELVGEIVKSYKEKGDVSVETVKQLALQYQPSGQRPPTPMQSSETVADKIKQFAGGSTAGTLGGTKNVFEVADSATSASTRIPTLPNRTNSTSTIQHGGGVGQGFASGDDGRGAVGGGFKGNLKSIGPVQASVQNNFLPNDFSVAAPASGGRGAGGNAGGGVSANFFSPDSGGSARAASAPAEPSAPTERRVSTVKDIFVSDTNGDSVSGGRSVPGRGISSVDATTIPAIDGIIGSPATEALPREMLSVSEEAVDLATAKIKPGATTNRRLKSARAALLKQAPPKVQAAKAPAP